MKSVERNTKAGMKEKYSMSTWGEKIPEWPGVPSVKGSILLLLFN